MASVRNNDAERFVDAPPPQYFLFLVHGSDAGLVRERASRLVARRVDDRHDPFQFVELSGDAIAADPLRLLDEANTAPLLGGRRALLVDAGAKTIVPAIERLLDAPPQDCSVIVTAGALRKDAPLRKLVEGAEAGASIECSPDAEAHLNALIDSALREARLSISPEARGLLTNALGEDRMMSRAELLKLTLYMHGRTRVEAADVAAIVAHAASAPGDALTLSAFSGGGEALGADFDDALAHGADPTLIVMNALRYAQGLHRGRAAGGVMGVKRAGFFGAPDSVIGAHLKLWPLEALGALVEFLRAAQTRARANVGAARLEAANALAHIAGEARRNRGRSAN
jgi:DNA polymerase III subunit delta